jgi:hypothetical protein
MLGEYLAFHIKPIFFGLIMLKVCIFQALKCACMPCKRVKPSSFDLKKVGRIHMPSI